MEVNAHMSLNRPERCPQGPGDKPIINSDKSSKSQWFYRRTAKKRFKLQTAEIMRELMDLDPQLAQIYDDRNVRVEALNEVHRSTVGGQYFSPGNTTQPGVINNADGEPETVHLTGKYEMCPAYDINACEQPSPNQTIPVCKEIVEQLQMYTMFKARTVELLQSTKNKATQLVKPYRNSQTWKTHQVAMATALAFEPSDAEILALTHIKSPAVASKWTFVNDTLKGGNKDLVDCMQTKPRIITRFLNAVYTSPDLLTPLPLNKAALDPRKH